MFESWLGELVKNTSYEMPMVLAVALVPLVGTLIFSDKIRLWRPFKVAIPISALGVIGLVFNFLAIKNQLIYPAVLSLILVPWVVCLTIYINNAVKLRRVKALSDRDSLNCDITKAVVQINKILPKYLTKKQTASLARSRLLMLVNLGSIRAAKEMLDELQEDKAFCLFVQHYISHKSGNMTGAKDYIKQAEDAIRHSTDPYIIPQIQLNHGCSYVTVKNYPVADEYFQKASESYKKHKMKDKTLLGTIYYNWAFNQTRLHSGETAKTAVYRLLAQYEVQLDLKKHSDALKLFNLKLEMFRQLGIPREEIDRLVNEVFTTLINKKMPLANKCIFAASVARVVWTGFLNPEQCLVFLQENIQTLDELRAENRYFAYKELDALFANIHGPMVARFEKLKAKTEQYMQQFAERDLEQWGAHLPSKAVYARCQCLTEKAGLQRKLPGYDREKAMRYLNSAVDLYAENELHWEAGIAHLNCADELCGPENLDDDCRPAQQEEMRQHLAAVEKFIPRMAEHPALAEIHLRLAFYYSTLDEYSLAMLHYRTYRQTRVALANFAPWLHRYAMTLALEARVLHFYEGIRKVQKSEEGQLNTATLAAKQWFTSFPNHDGRLDGCLLGKFLGYEQAVPLKIKMWLDKADMSAPKDHCWLWIRELGLNLDITFGQFTQEVQNRRIFFHLDRHPLESGQASIIQNSIRATHITFQIGIHGIYFAKLPQEEQSLGKEILALVQQEIPEDCPTVEEIQELFAQTMMPVPAVETE